jgi:hypothetical protein
MTAWGASAGAGAGATVLLAAGTVLRRDPVLRGVNPLATSFLGQDFHRRWRRACASVLGNPLMNPFSIHWLHPALISSALEC